MEKNSVYGPTYKSFHRDIIRRRNECERTITKLADKHGVYANEIRRCFQMYSRVADAIEVDPA